ncbi:thioesterase-like superfamily-domain-containing protein [Bombardia bombarda]|uniref:Thioesterase-like superfamily-domain-containing protein n=1 Tax=Bombardia bombarda TaxID=252184 RepID=A0AA39TJM4_9PEZI|nr:thioesterase-like superfamily-domain-containing protein [Bombardia bombarda]
MPSTMVPIKKNTQLIPFSDAIKIAQLDSHTYAANLYDTFCIGTVPNGGYVASCLLSAASIHLSSRGQVDVLTSHFEFISRTEVGPAVIVIEDIKLGRQLSTLHLTLYQDALLPHAPFFTPASSRKELLAYFTMTNLSREKGVSLPTNFSLHPPSPSDPDFALLKDGKDKIWQPLVFAADDAFGYIRCLQNVIYYLPKHGQPEKSIIDLWVRLANPGEKFTAASLAFVADCWPYVVEAYRPKTKEQEKDAAFKKDAVFWYPTVVLNLETKKNMGPGGNEWLRLRVQAKEIKNGRLDIEVLIFDIRGDLVALSQHVNLVLGSERNTAGRSGKKVEASKI